MKKLFCFMSIVCLLASCSKEPAPEPLVVTNAKLAGTWVYDNTTTGVTEVLKFTNNGRFYYTTTLADAAFAGAGAGNYSVSDDVNLTAVGVDKSLDVTITKLSANSFTAKDKVTGESTTYAKLIETIELEYGKSDTPGYSSLVAGSITSYKSHNVKVATVDKTGAITAVAEGITLIDVVASEGTAVVLVKAEGLIPDYAKVIGYTRDEVLAEYGATEGSYNLVYRFNEADAEYETTYYVSRRTKVVERIKVEYTRNPKYINKIAGYLSTKYYQYEDYFVDKAPYAEAGVKIEWDGLSELMYTYINHDLFEDFSIAINQPVDAVRDMYAELEIFKETNYSIEYKIGEIQIGFTGVDKMDRVQFYHNGDNVTSVLLKLKKEVKQSDVESFLAKKYGAAVNEDEYGTLYYFDAVHNINVEYDSTTNTVSYN